MLLPLSHNAILLIKVKTVSKKIAQVKAMPINVLQYTISLSCSFLLMYLKKVVSIPKEIIAVSMAVQLYILVNTP
jgi:hypothetical protein